MMVAYTLVGEDTLVPNHPDEPLYANVKDWEYLLNAVLAMKRDAEGVLHFNASWVGYKNEHRSEWYPARLLRIASQMSWLARATADNGGNDPLDPDLGEVEIRASDEHIWEQERDTKEYIASKVRVWRRWLELLSRSSP